LAVSLPGFNLSVLMPGVLMREASQSVASSMRLLVGLPAPCPARVSMRMRTGFGRLCAAYSAAANLKLWPGSAGSAVVTIVDDYLVLAFRLGVVSRGTAP
jgi:hypothetical protein